MESSVRIPSSSLCVFFLLGSAVAEAGSLRCDHCDARGFESAARAMGAGSHVIFSVTQGVAAGFVVEREVLDRRGGSQVQFFAYRRPLTADEAAQFEAVKRIYRETGPSLMYEVVVPIRDIPIQQPLDFSGMTAYEFARRMGDWHRVAQGVVQWGRTYSPLAQAGQWWQVAGSVVGAAGAELEVTVVFACGGRVTYRMDYGDETMAEQRGPIRDTNNNIIPTPTDSPAVQNGSVVFANTVSVDRMNEHLSNIGSPLRFPLPPPTCRPPGPIVYECAWGPGMITYSCRRLGVTGC
ncbi:MAG: hypothetical protein LW828_03575 [Xanthomonadaceae bacterium]|jgi:hypothetical protein|nr:hypothetical protein [Xanthomonadaceae bacterium]